MVEAFWFIIPLISSRKRLNPVWGGGPAAQRPRLPAPKCQVTSKGRRLPPTAEMPKRLIPADEWRRQHLFSATFNRPEDRSGSLTAAVSFSFPDTVTASVSSGTDMLLPHIHCTRCCRDTNIRSQLTNKQDRTANITSFEDQTKDF